MAVTVIAGSTAMYVGKDKKLRNKKMVLQENCRTTSTSYLFIVDGERDVLVSYVDIEWINRNSVFDGVQSTALPKNKGITVR